MRWRIVVAVCLGTLAGASGAAAEPLWTPSTQGSERHGDMGLPQGSSDPRRQPVRLGVGAGERCGSLPPTGRRAADRDGRSRRRDPGGAGERARLRGRAGLRRRRGRRRRLALGQRHSSSRQAGRCDRLGCAGDARAGRRCGRAAPRGGRQRRQRGGVVPERPGDRRQSSRGRRVGVHRLHRQLDGAAFPWSRGQHERVLLGQRRPAHRGQR